MSEQRIPIGEWLAMSAEWLDEHNREWCRSHGHTENVEQRDGIVQRENRLPYRFDPEDRNFILVQQSFLDMPKRFALPQQPLTKADKIRTMASPYCQKCDGTGHTLFLDTWILCSCVTGK